MEITEKVSYIKGLADGLDLDKNSKEGKLFAAIIDVLDDIAEAVKIDSEFLDELADEVDDISDYLFEDDVDDYCTGDCDNCEGCDFDDDEEGVYSFDCPVCNQPILFDESVYEDEDAELICPACGAKLDRDTMSELNDEEE